VGPPATDYLLNTSLQVCILKVLRKKGEEWDHVTIIEPKDDLHQHKVECK